MARDNRTLGRFHLDGIPPAPRGLPQIEVTFDIDANGIVNVSARDKATNKEQKITITASSGLDEAEIRRMVSQAEEHADDDRRARDLVEARNQADQVIYQVEKLLRENREQIPAPDLPGIEAALKDAKEAVASEDLERIRKSTEALTRASHQVAERIYRGAAAAGERPADSSETPGDGKSGDVIDAEYVDASDKKS